MSDEATVLVSISEIDARLRPASDMRARLDDEAIAEYAGSIDQMPPVQLAYDAATGSHWVIDGAHTISGAKRIGRTQVRATVISCDWLEAFRRAARTNSAHGVRITNADKRHRVEVALKDPEMSRWSNRRIAEWCGVHHQIVGNLRPEQLDDSSSSEQPPKTIGRDGKSRRPPEPRRPQSVAEPRISVQAVPPAPEPIQVSSQEDIRATFKPVDVPEPVSEPIAELSPDDNERWLESLPLRRQVANPAKFDADALIVRHCKPQIQAIKDTIADVIGLRSPATMTPLHRALFRVFDIADPRFWQVCSHCAGRGADDSGSQCRPCVSTGYVIPNFTKGLSK